MKPRYAVEQPKQRVAALQINFPLTNFAAGEMIFRGTPEFIEQARNELTFVVHHLASGVGVSGADLKLMGRELMGAREALAKCEDFEGELVAVTIWRH